MFTLQIVGNAYVPLTVWSDLKQFTSEKAWRHISVGGLVAEWYGGGRESGEATVVCVFDIVNLAVEPLGIDSVM